MSKWFRDKKCRLIFILLLTALYFFIEITVGYLTNSMALVADSFHMLGDIAALTISFMSLKMSPKKWSKNTFGWARAEVLGALVNAVFLVALCLGIIIEAFKRIIEPQIIHEPELLVIVGTIGLGVNIIGMFLLHDHAAHRPACVKIHHLAETDTPFGGAVEPPLEECLKTVTVATKHKYAHAHGAGHMNMHGIFLHLLSDALGSIIVVISAVVIWKTDWQYRYYLDPALLLVLVCLILHSVWPLLRESALILLQTVPAHLQVDDIEKRLLQNVDGILGVHEFHIWQLAGNRIIASLHIRCKSLSQYMRIATDVKKFFHNEGIHSTTVQPEFVELDSAKSLDISTDSFANDDSGCCSLNCPISEEDCVEATCCQFNQRCHSPARDLEYECHQRKPIVDTDVSANVAAEN